MAFTLTPIAAKDSASTAIGGGLMAADVAGGGVGPFFLFNGLVDGVAGVNRATIDSSNRLAVHIGAAAAAIAKAEDVASADADVGVGALAVRKATPANTSGTDGDYEFLQMSAGRLWTNTLIGDGTNAAAIKAASTAAVATDPALVVAISPNNVLAAGQALSTSSTPVVPASDWFPTFSKLEDIASASGDCGVPALAIQKATPADLAGTDADYAFLQMSGGRLWASSQTYGDVAHDGVDSGNPVKGGHKATTSLAGLTMVADADRVNSYAGVDGVQIVRPHCNLEDIVASVATCTSGANTSGIAAQGAGVKFYLCAVLVTNVGGTAAGNLSITDGSGGTEKANVPFSTAGAVENLPVPIAFSANTAVFVDPSGSDTIKVTLVGFKSKV